MNPSRPDVVFDCNILLQAISRETGPAAAALRLMEQNKITLHLSKSIVREFRRSLDYPEIRERNPHVTNERIYSFISRLLFRAVLYRNVPHVLRLPRDPDDEPYLDLAIAAQADFLVTCPVFFRENQVNGAICLLSDTSRLLASILISASYCRLDQTAFGNALYRKA